MGGIKRYPPEPMSLIRALLLCIVALNDVFDRYEMRGYTDWRKSTVGLGYQDKENNTPAAT